MMGTVLGLPAATFLGEWLNWRASFLAVAVIALFVGFLILKLMPTMPETTNAHSLRSELAHFRNRHLWYIYATSLLLIGSTFAACTYFAPILITISGFTPSSIPLLLIVYGLSTLVGNNLVGRLADRHTIAVIVVGLLILVFAMVIFAIFGQSRFIATISLIAIGLTGVSMNPALVTREARAGKNSMLVNSVHTACIMLGVMIGSWIGGVSVEAGLGLHGPLWIGAGLAVLALLTLLPELHIRNYRSIQR
jgi:predicted MFS family arabinose efflux permease